jgi:hypothetical protein
VDPDDASFLYTSATLLTLSPLASQLVNATIAPKPRSEPLPEKAGRREPNAPGVAGWKSLYY